MTGDLVIDPSAPSFDAGVAAIAVEDARRVDRPAVALARIRIDGVSHRAGVGERIGFAIDCPAPPAGQGWAIRAELDRPRPGQFTTERVEVDGRGAAILLQLRWSPGETP